jgi:hypothetical protein
MVVIHALNGTARYWTYHEILPLLSEFSNNTRTKPPGALFANGSPSPHATIPAASDVDLAPGPTVITPPGQIDARRRAPSSHDHLGTTILARKETICLPGLEQNAWKMPMRSSTSHRTRRLTPELGRQCGDPRVPE